ncbi:MAG: prolyl oligopeptidase family protein [Planctomycetota bacterium]|nr:prolyl oligopeptidase family protein [Planctomycetota bacterium]
MRSMFTFLLLALTFPALADGPSDNIPAKVRPIPPRGIAVPDAERKGLEEGLTKLAEKIAAIEAKNDTKRTRFLPDIRIHHKAVRYALDGDEFFDPKEVATARDMIAEGLSRASSLLETGKAAWMDVPGEVYLGYVSKIDGSVQPYSLIVPESWQRRSPYRHRLDIWFHGRGETRTEVFYYKERHNNLGEFAPEDALVLHPYGRFCNAAKFAGEVDAFEALDDVKSRYKIDEDRISVRGFSMGGASAWHFAVHYPDKWFAANPGAGFSETPRFLDVFQKEKLEPTWYEKKLWQMYDCTDWAENLSGCPTVAYSGELDSQKQAADVMAEALERQNLRLKHVIGPKTRHQYDPSAKREVIQIMDSLARLGRDRSRREVDFWTPTLRYNRSAWITIDELGEHWEAARVHATLDDGFTAYRLVAQNVTAMTIEFPAGTVDPAMSDRLQTFIFADAEGQKGQVVDRDGPKTDLSFRVSFHKEGKEWMAGPRRATGLRKKHGLQGPIDDAFLERFTFVRPTGTSKNEKVTAWVKSEGDRAVRRWRTQMRGDAIVRDDTAVSDADIASSNLVLWGDPESNAVLKKIADKLPIRWDGDNVVVGEKTYSAADHVPILIFPNPLNAEKYVVLNSGFTYREYDDLNNARQVPKLPDWAIVDVRTPPNSRYPGKIVAADFFDEAWKIKTKKD